MKTVLSILFLIISISGNSQDTTWFDTNWKKTTDRENAKYYRLIKQDDDRYLVTDYFLDGKTQMKGLYSSMNPEVKDGQFTYYFENGVISKESFYNKGKETGIWSEYDKDGKLKRKEEYKDDGSTLMIFGEDEALVIVEEMPTFPGGDDALRAYFSKNISYPKNAKKNKIQGRVYINFVVDKEGNIKKAKILRGIDPECDAEALRVVSEMPKWKPGKQNGRNVDVSFNIPIVFSLNEKK